MLEYNCFFLTTVPTLRWSSLRIGDRQQLARGELEFVQPLLCRRRLPSRVKLDKGKCTGRRATPFWWK